jgi:hypothetical protein
MAFCPKCKEVMSVMETICPHCGYDFPAMELVQSAFSEPSGIAYSGLAEFALIVGEFAAGFSAVISLFMAAMFLIGFRISYLFGAIIVFFLCLANFVVFERVRNMGNKR